MKNRNPHLSCIILWIIVIFVNLTACIFGVINGILWQAFFNLAIVMIDCICLGWCICKFNSYKELLERKKEIDKSVVDFLDWLKNENSEPFKEFENEKE